MFKFTIPWKDGKYPKQLVKKGIVAGSYYSPNLGDIAAGFYVVVTHGLDTQELFISLQYKPTSGSYQDKWIDADAVLKYVVQDSDTVRIYNVSASTVVNGRAQIFISAVEANIPQTSWNLDEVCKLGAITDQDVEVADLRVVGDISVAGSVVFENGNVSFSIPSGNFDIGNTGGFVHIWSGGSGNPNGAIFFSCNELFRWRQQSSWILRMSLDSSTGDLWVDGELTADGDLTVNYNHSNVDSIISFGKPTSGFETFKFNKTEGRFELSNTLKVTAGAIYAKNIENIRYADKFTSVQAALDDLPSSGGIVMLPVGTSVVSSTLIVAPSKILRGYGEASVLRLANGANCDVIQASGDYIILEDFVIDGNKSNNTLGSGIFLNGAYAYSLLKNVHVKYCAEYGMKFANCSCVHVVDGWSHHSNKDAVYVYNGCESINFYTMVAEYVGAGYAGFNIKESGPLVLSGCHVEDCDYAYKIDGSFGITLESPYAAMSGANVTPVHICGSSNNVSVINISVLGSGTSGYLINDVDRSVTIPISFLTATYYTDNFVLNKTLYLHKAGSVSASLYYSVGWGRFELDHNLYVNGSIELTGGIDVGENVLAGGVLRARSYAQVNSDWTSGDEDAQIFFDGTFVSHRAEFKYDYGLDSFWMDKELRVSSAGNGKGIVVADEDTGTLYRIKVKSGVVVCSAV